VRLKNKPYFCKTAQILKFTKSNGSE